MRVAGSEGGGEGPVGFAGEAAEYDEPGESRRRGGWLRRCGVCVAPLDLDGLKERELVARLVDVAGARAAIDGLFAQVAGRLVETNGRVATAWIMLEYTRVSGFQARCDTALAGDLVEHGLSDTLSAMSAGEITAGHARVIANAAPKPHRKGESELLALARDYAVDTCGRYTLAYESRQQMADDAAAAAAAASNEPGDAEYQAQRAERKASLRPTTDGMWELTGRFDYLTGRRINQKLHAMIASLRQEPGDAARSYPQRAADALAQLITGEGNHLRPATSLLLIADYDTVAGQIAKPRLDDGTPLPADLLAELATNAKVLPAIFDATWSNLALGTSRRNASDAQKLVLAARDGGCISCQAHTEATHAHHIRFWSHDGPTDIPNLATLCPHCHDLAHDHNWTVTTPPDGHPKLRGPNTSACNPTRQPPTPRPSSTPSSAPETADPAQPAWRRLTMRVRRRARVPPKRRSSPGRAGQVGSARSMARSVASVPTSCAQSTSHRPRMFTPNSSPSAPSTTSPVPRM